MEFLKKLNRISGKINSSRSSLMDSTAPDLYKVLWSPGLSSLWTCLKNKMRISGKNWFLWWKEKKDGQECTCCRTCTNSAALTMKPNNFSTLTSNKYPWYNPVIAIRWDPELLQFDRAPFPSSFRTDKKRIGESSRILAQDPNPCARTIRLIIME